jgi:hypothetical protein
VREYTCCHTYLCMAIVSFATQMFPLQDTIHYCHDHVTVATVSLATLF